MASLGHLESRRQGHFNEVRESERGSFIRNIPDNIV